MKAQVLHKYDPDMKDEVWVKGEEMPDPKIEKASDVIVKIGAAGVCRTDLHIIEGVWKHIQDPEGKLLPCVMGHENAGWIEDVGKDVTEFKKGDPVILHPLISGTDGTCLDCRRGNDMHAANGSFPGLSIKEGGYSELLKTSVRNLIKLPKILAPKDVAPFSDAGLTAYRVVKKATRHLLPGQSCAIIGAGGLGHIAIQCLKAMCAADIIIVEKSEKDTILLIAGKGITREDFEGYESLVNKRIFYVGHIPWNSLVSMYKASDTFIHLSFLDHCPNEIGRAHV